MATFDQDKADALLLQLSVDFDKQAFKDAEKQIKRLSDMLHDASGEQKLKIDISQKAFDSLDKLPDAVAAITAAIKAAEKLYELTNTGHQAVSGYRGNYSAFWTAKQNNALEQKNWAKETGYDKIIGAKGERVEAEGQSLFDVAKQMYYNGETESNPYWIAIANLDHILGNDTFKDLAKTHPDNLQSPEQLQGFHLKWVRALKQAYDKAKGSKKNTVLKWATDVLGQGSVVPSLIQTTDNPDLQLAQIYAYLNTFDNSYVSGQKGSTTTAGGLAEFMSKIKQKWYDKIDPISAFFSTGFRYMAESDDPALKFWKNGLGKDIKGISNLASSLGDYELAKAHDDPLAGLNRALSQTYSRLDDIIQNGIVDELWKDASSGELLTPAQQKNVDKKVQKVLLGMRDDGSVYDNHGIGIFTWQASSAYRKQMMDEIAQQEWKEALDAENAEREKNGQAKRDRISKSALEAIMRRMYNRQATYGSKEGVLAKNRFYDLSHNSEALAKLAEENAHVYGDGTMTLNESMAILKYIMGLNGAGSMTDRVLDDMMRASLADLAIRSPDALRNPADVLDVMRKVADQISTDTKTKISVVLTFDEKTGQFGIGKADVEAIGKQVESNVELINTTYGE